MTDKEFEMAAEQIIETRFEKPINNKAKFAVEILKRYAEQTGNLLRGTSDLSPLEEWLIIQLFEEKTLPKLSGIKNGTKSKLFQEVLAEAKQYSPHLFRSEHMEACANIGRNILSKIDSI
jgi:hypothetical protein